MKKFRPRIYEGSFIESPSMVISRTSIAMPKSKVSYDSERTCIEFEAIEKNVILSSKNILPVQKHKKKIEGKEKATQAIEPRKERRPPSPTQQFVPMLNRRSMVLASKKSEKKNILEEKSACESLSRSESLELDRFVFPKECLSVTQTQNRFDKSPMKKVQKSPKPFQPSICLISQQMDLRSKSPVGEPRFEKLYQLRPIFLSKSAIEKAMNAESTGTISANAVPPPICMSTAASVPFSLNASMPNTNESAMTSPPRHDERQHVGHAGHQVFVGAG